MTIISQKYEIEFKNYIKNKILQKVDAITANLFNNICTYSKDKYLKIVSDLQTDIKFLITEIIKEAIIYFDTLFRNSPERKKIIGLILKLMKELTSQYGEKLISAELIMKVKMEKHISTSLMNCLALIKVKDMILFIKVLLLIWQLKLTKNWLQKLLLPTLQL